jgi:hypothetical protein
VAAGVFAHAPGALAKSGNGSLVGKGD